MAGYFGVMHLGIFGKGYKPWCFYFVAFTQSPLISLTCCNFGQIVLFPSQLFKLRDKFSALQLVAFVKCVTFLHVFLLFLLCSFFVCQRSAAAGE